MENVDASGNLKFDMAVVSCSDPRVTPTLEALQTIVGFGRVLMIRNPGGLLNKTVVGEIVASGAERVLVLDHTECAAHKHIHEGIENGGSKSLPEKVRRALESAGVKNGDIATVAQLSEMLRILHTKSYREHGLPPVTAHTIDVAGLSVGHNKTLIISDDPTRSSSEIAKEAGVEVGSAYIIKAGVIKAGYVTLLREVIKDKETGAPGKEVWLVNKPANLELKERLELGGTNPLKAEVRRAEPSARRKITG